MIAFPAGRASSCARRFLALPILATALAVVSCTDAGMMSTGPTPEPMESRKPREPTPPPTSNPFTGATLYVDPGSHARKQADLWRTSRPEDAKMMDKIAAQSQAAWFGEWSGDIRAATNNVVTAAAKAGQLAVLIAYNIPQRDCGGLSGGGGASADAYRSWITGFADGIGTRKAVVILEPDALPMLDCLSSADQQLRLELLRYAVQTFKAKGQISVYIDAGHSNWHSASVMVNRLKNAGVDQADGFSLNVSNFQFNDPNIRYGVSISDQIGGKLFVIDTGRNGNGPTADNEWCNPEGRALGSAPTANTGHARVAAFLWLKTPGESDGACRGNPPAGTWMPEYALGLAKRASW